ncbi:unnamed protein product [Protopolystoma xenopodis]|uniref:LIM zinc-binding domain-containing protein n=1 Tax=Protopolystoma xenopodis TaxID=117903 RepID=A0A448WT81_9PLAT|nr:unnamed protein product [Protopolystoma xenopodis]
MLTNCPSLPQLFGIRSQPFNGTSGPSHANLYPHVHASQYNATATSLRNSNYRNNQQGNSVLMTPFSRYGQANVVCANCDKPVYANERVDAVCKVYHRLCFKCSACGRLLERGSACDHAHNIYCRGKFDL